MSATTSKTEYVEAIVDLLKNAASSVWSTTQDPNVFRWQAKSQQERGPGATQPPELYVWMPTSAPINRLTADNDLLEELPNIEIHVYTLTESDTSDLARDLISFFSDYMSDRENRTEYADIVPVNAEDFREQKLAQRTEHFVYTVEIEVTKLTDTGV